MTSTDDVRISFLVPAFARAPGGGARTYYEHANRLAQRGFDVTVVHSLGCRGTGTGRFVDPFKERLRDLRSGHIRRGISWMTIDPQVSLRFVHRFDGTTRLPPADIRIGTFWRTTEYLAARPPDGAALMQLIQAYETWAGPADRVDAVWRLGVHCAVVSPALRDRGLKLGVPADLIHVVPNGVDLATFAPRSRYTERKPQLAFLAHEAPVKGLSDAVAVAAAVHASRPDVPVVAFGSSARPALLPRFVEYVHRPVGAELVRRVYDRTTVFLCASHSEGWGFPSMEAMACGAALVSTRNGGVDGFAVDQHSALLNDVGDVEGLTRSVLHLLEDENRRIAIAAEGIRSVGRFTWDASADAFDAVVRTALNGRGARP